MQGVNLALVGMGVVFTFLAALVFLTTLMSRVVARYPAPDAGLETIGGDSRPASGSNSPEGVADRQRLVAVITAAIRQHRGHR